MTKSRVFFAAALLSAAAAPGLQTTAQAQGFDTIASSVTDTFQYAIDLLPRDVTAIRLGVGPVVLPEYMGDDRYKISPAPLISLRYRDWFEIDNNELKITARSKLVNTRTEVGGGRLRFGPLISLDFGRDENDSNDLIGLGNVGTSLELGAFVGYAYGPVRGRIKAKYDVAGGHGGALIKGDVSLAVYRDEKLSVGSVASVTWASSDYMNSYFGITGAQSVGSGLAVYAPGSGFRDFSLGLGGNYAINDRFSVISNVGYSRLLKDAKNSPLVAQRGSPNQWQFSSYVVYSF